MKLAARERKDKKREILDLLPFFLLPPTASPSGSSYSSSSSPTHGEKERDLHQRQQREERKSAEQREERERNACGLT
jgi:hypothetical protein